MEELTVQHVPLTDVPNDSPLRTLPLDWMAWDYGFAFQKAFSTRNREGAIMRTLMGRTSKPMSVARAFLGAAEVMGTELLYRGVRYLFGHHAARQFMRDPNRLTGKVSDDLRSAGDELPLIVSFFQATLALVFPQPGSYRVNLLVALPVDKIDNDRSYVQRVTDALKGQHVFHALSSFSSDGSPVYSKWTVLIENVAVREQTLGRLFDLGYDEVGTPTPKLDELANGVSVLFDMGGGTTDISVVMPTHDGKGNATFERVDEMCGSDTQLGINTLYDYLRDSVFSPRGLYLTDVDLDAAVMAGQYVDRRTNNTLIDLTEAIETGRAAMWQQCQALLQRTVRLDDAKVARFVCTGGAVGWVEKFLVEQYGEHRVIRASNGDTYKDLMYTEGLPLQNIRGWFKALMRTANA
jgi:hypothetical protein